MTETRWGVEHYDVLLAQMMRSPTILHLASELEGAYFVDPRIGGTIGQTCVFEIIKNYYKRFQSMPDAAVILADARAVAERYLHSPEKHASFEQEICRIISVTKLVTERSEPLARQIVAHIADICVHKEAVKQQLDDYRESGDIAALRDKLTLIETKRAAMTGGLSTTDIITLPFLDAGRRIPTYIPWLDARFGDGVGPVSGCSLSILAPQGHGKTTLGIQLAVAQALAGEHALLVLAEEGLTLPMRCKIFASALGIPFKLFECRKDEQGNDITTFGDAIAHAVRVSGINQELASRKISSIKKYLHYLDMSKGKVTPEVVDVIGAEIETLRSRGEPPKYVYVDWAGKIVEAIVPVTGNTKTQELQTLASRLSTTAERTDTIIAISHQMSPNIVKRGPFAVNDMYCAESCRSFTETHKYVFVINPRDERTELSIMRVPKSRDDPRGDHLVLKLRGDIAAIHDVTDDWELQGKRLLKRGRQSARSVPRERNQTRSSRTPEVSLEG